MRVLQKDKKYEKALKIQHLKWPKNMRKSIPHQIHGTKNMPTKLH